MVTRYAAQPCPHCGHKLDASEGFEEDLEPVRGDVSVCVSCHGFLVFEECGEKGGELVQRKLTPREFAKLPGGVRADLLRARANLERIAAEKKRAN